MVNIYMYIYSVTSMIQFITQFVIINPHKSGASIKRAKVDVLNTACRDVSEKLKINFEK